jgi:actin-related protein
LHQHIVFANEKNRLRFVMADDLFCTRFLEREQVLPKLYVPLLYRHLLRHSSAAFVDRWRSAAIQKLGHVHSEEALLKAAIAEYVAACSGETEEIAAHGVDLLPNLYRSDCSFLVAKTSILQEGLFVCQSNAFTLQFSTRLFESGFGKIGFKSADLLPLSLLTPSESIFGQSIRGYSPQRQLTLAVSSLSSLAVSPALRNQTSCSLVSWLALSLSCGQNIIARNFGAEAAKGAETIIVYRNRTLCSRIVRAAVTCPIVLDCSSWLMRAGFCSDPAPGTVFFSVACRRQHPRASVIMNWRPHFFGDEALQDAAVEEFGSQLLFPVQNGIIANWDTMECLWQHTFYQKLRVEPSNHPVLLTEAVMNSKADRYRMVQIMFETFSVPALHICSRPVLCLHGSRCSTGVVVQCSSSECSIVPIIDGHVLPHAISRSCFHSGDDLTSHMIALLQLRGVSFPERISRPCQQSQKFRADHDTFWLVRRLQEALCYVALDYDLEMQTVIEATYEIPLQLGHAPAADICIGSERFACPEILFRPLLPSVAGIHTATDAVIKACDAHIQHRLYGNILLAGGSISLPGMQARMEKEMRAAAPGVHVSVSAASKHSAWTGGALLASSPQFLNTCMLNAEYDEFGPTIVESKCPAYTPM